MDVLQEHQRALDDFVARVGAIPPDQWTAPRAPGHWSAAQELAHVTLTYEIFASELSGGPGMRIAVPVVRRTILRWLVLPYVLWTGRFPGRPRAPRETRPPENGSREEWLGRLRIATETVSASLATALRDRSRIRLSHAYFGKLTLREGLRLVTVHTRHHARKLSER